jgi:hypothetical protein
MTNGMEATSGSTIKVSKDWVEQRQPMSALVGKRTFALDTDVAVLGRQDTVRSSWRSLESGRSFSCRPSVRFRPIADINALGSFALHRTMLACAGASEP